MTRSVTPLPERLRTAGATSLERQLLGAAAREQPSPELTARMAAAIGVAAPAPALSASSAVPRDAAPAPAAPAPAAVAKPLVAWVAGAAAMVAVAAAVVAVRSGGGSPQPAPPSPARVQAPTLVMPTTERPAESPPVAQRESSSNPVEATSAERGRSSPTAGDLGDQIALIDGARTAVAAGAGNRALEILRKYQSKYPAGGFRPEAAALKIEALVKLGRTAEARALAERFVADHGGTALADRVARIAGLRGAP